MSAAVVLLFVAFAFTLAMLADCCISQQIKDEEGEQP